MIEMKTILGLVVGVLAVGNILTAGISSARQGVKAPQLQKQSGDGQALESVPETSEVEYVDGPLAPLYDFLIQRRLQRFCKLLRDAGLEQTIQELGGSFTLFVPTDASFVFLPGGTLEELQRNPALLRDFILYHFVAGDFPSNQIQNEMLVDSVQGSPLRFNIYGQLLTVSGAEIVESDLLFDMGRIYIIDRPLHPIPSTDIASYLQNNHRDVYRMLVDTDLLEYISSGVFTFLVPDEQAFRYLSADLKDALAANRSLAEKILLNHILPGSLYVGGITDGMQWETTGGTIITFTVKRGLIFANEIPVVLPDVPLTNGVIHVINRVLLPEGIENDCQCKPSSDTFEKQTPQVSGRVPPSSRVTPSPQVSQTTARRPWQSNVRQPVQSTGGQTSGTPGQPSVTHGRPSTQTNNNQRPQGPAPSRTTRRPWNPPRASVTRGPPATPAQFTRQPYLPTTHEEPENDINSVVRPEEQTTGQKRPGQTQSRYPPSPRQPTQRPHSQTPTRTTSETRLDVENNYEQDISLGVTQTTRQANAWSQRQRTPTPRYPTPQRGPYRTPVTTRRPQTTRTNQWNQPRVTQPTFVEQPDHGTFSENAVTTEHPQNPTDSWNQRRQATRPPAQRTTQRSSRVPPISQRQPVPVIPGNVSPVVPATDIPLGSNRQNPPCRLSSDRITWINRNWPLCPENQLEDCQNPPINPADRRPPCSDIQPPCRNANEPYDPADNRPICSPVENQDCRPAEEQTYPGDTRPPCEVSSVSQTGCKDPSAPYNPSDRRPLCRPDQTGNVPPDTNQNNQQGCRRPHERTNPNDRRPLCPDDPQEDCRSILERPKPGDRRPVCKTNGPQRQKPSSNTDQKKPTKPEGQPSYPQGQSPTQTTRRQSWQSTTRYPPRWQSTAAGKQPVGKQPQAGATPVPFQPQRESSPDTENYPTNAPYPLAPDTIANPRTGTRPQGQGGHTGSLQPNQPRRGALAPPQQQTGSLPSQPQTGSIPSRPQTGFHQRAPPRLPPANPNQATPQTGSVPPQTGFIPSQPHADFRPSLPHTGSVQSQPQSGVHPSQPHTDSHSPQPHPIPSDPSQPQPGVSTIPPRSGLSQPAHPQTVNQPQQGRPSSRYPQPRPPSSGFQNPQAPGGFQRPGIQGVPLQPGSPGLRPDQPSVPQRTPWTGQRQPASTFAPPPRRVATTTRHPISVTGTSSTPAEDSRRTLYEIVEEPALLIRGRPVMLTKIFSLFHTAGLDDILTGTGPTTVFLPSDDAFAALPKGVVDQLEENPDLLRQVLLYHVTNTEILPSAQGESFTVPSLEGTPLVITMVNGGKLILISGAKAVAVTKASNGIFYVVNQLLYPLPHRDIFSAIQSRPDLSIFAWLLPLSGLTEILQGETPYTVLAPTDTAFAQLPQSTYDELTQNTTALREVLLNHIIEGAHYGREFLTGVTFPSARGGKLRFQVVSYGYQVNDVNIKTPEIVTGTGVIHLIDQVLLEPPDVIYFNSLENAVGGDDNTGSNQNQPPASTHGQAAPPRGSVAPGAGDSHQFGGPIPPRGSVLPGVGGPNQIGGRTPPRGAVVPSAGGPHQIGGLQPTHGQTIPVGRTPAVGQSVPRTQPSQPQRGSPFAGSPITNDRANPRQPATVGRQPQISNTGQQPAGQQTPSRQNLRGTQGQTNQGFGHSGRPTPAQVDTVAGRRPVPGAFSGQPQRPSGHGSGGTPWGGSVGPSVSSGQAHDVAELARTMGLNQFANWVTNTGLLEKIHDGGVYTVFAPTDDAVNALPQDMVYSIESNPEQVKSILQYHIVPQKLNLNSVTNEETASTLLQDKKIRFNVYDNPSPGCRQLVTASGTPLSSSLATMGPVQVIPVTQVLYQPAGDLQKIIDASPILQKLSGAVKNARLTWILSGTGPITIFAPSDTAFDSLTEEQRKTLIEDKQAFADVLKRHIVRGTFFSSGVQEDVEKNSENGKPLSLALKEGILNINSIPVTYADITASNGVLHVIDQFLI